MTHAKSSAKSFVAKAERLIRWARLCLEEMVKHGSQGQLDDMERSLFSVLALTASLHGAIGAAAKHAKQPDWRAQFDRRRSDDPLLAYLWKARDVDIHDSILTWKPGLKSLELKIVDAERAHTISRQFYADQSEAARFQRLLQYIYEANSMQQVMERFRRMDVPKQEVLAKAGITLQAAMNCIWLRDFTCQVGRKTHVVYAPATHLGSACPAAAHEAAEIAITYYASQLRELCSLAPQARAPTNEAQEV